MQSANQPPKEQLFTINYSDATDYICGINEAGTQCLLGIGSDRLFGIFFSAHGDYLHSAVRALQPPTFADLDSGEQLFQRLLWMQSQLETWQIDLGVTPGTIRVHPFFSEEFRVGVANLPGSYIRAALNHNRVSAAHQDELERQLATWRKSYNHVLIWGGTEFWLNPNGDVVAS